MCSPGRLPTGNEGLDGERLGLRDLLSKVINRASMVLLVSEVPVVLLQFWILSES